MNNFMKNTRLLLVVASVMPLLMSNCKKESADYREKYVGRWYKPYYQWDKAIGAY